MQVFYVVTHSDHPEGRTKTGPYTSRVEAERAMTRIAEQGFSLYTREHGSRRQAFKTVEILTEQTETEGE